MKLNNTQQSSQMAPGYVSTMTFPKAVKVLRNNFELLNAASSCPRQGQVTRKDLQNILHHPEIPTDVKSAAVFLLRNPAYFQMLASERVASCDASRLVVSGQAGISLHQLDSYWSRSDAPTTSLRPAVLLGQQAAKPRTSCVNAYRASAPTARPDDS